MATVIRAYDSESAFAGEPQCLHGDVTPGNVLFRSSGRAHFCDFEDAAFCYRPIVFDVASAVLRFCIEPPKADGLSTSMTRRGCFNEAYEKAGGTLPSDDTVNRAMVNLVDHNIMVLCTLADEESQYAASEWDKFSRLRGISEGIA